MISDLGNFVGMFRGKFSISLIRVLAFSETSGRSNHLCKLLSFLKNFGCSFDIYEDRIKIKRLSKKINILRLSQLSFNMLRMYDLLRVVLSIKLKSLNYVSIIMT